MSHLRDVCQWQNCAWYLYLFGLERGSGRANRKWCARAGQFRGTAGSGGGRVYISACAGGNYCCVLERCLLSLIVSSETSAIRTQTPGNYPKRNKLHEFSC